MDEKLKIRFWAKVDKRPPGECWPWTGAINNKGYGHFWVANRRYHPAHRFAMMTLDTELDGLVVDHLCRNRACCNPAHLEAVTTRENILRGVGPSAQNAAKKICPQGHFLGGQNLGVNNQNARYCKICVSRRQREIRKRMTITPEQRVKKNLANRAWRARKKAALA